jgi:hypothetical protein
LPRSVNNISAATRRPVVCAHCDAKRPDGDTRSRCLTVCEQSEWRGNAIERDIVGYLDERLELGAAHATELPRVALT